MVGAWRRIPRMSDQGTPRIGIMVGMTLVKYLSIPLIILVVGIVYWFLSYEASGTALLIIFAIAMALMGWALVPTFGDAGPTAPVDPEWHERRG